MSREQPLTDNESLNRREPCPPGPTLREVFEETLAAITPPEQPKPTVGRIVHYYRQAGGLLPLGKPVAAIVYEVYGDGDGTFVGLECFGDAEHNVVHRSVPFSPFPRAGCWSWPPR